jgi:hypothetical protein
MTNSEIKEGDTFTWNGQDWKVDSFDKSNDGINITHTRLGYSEFRIISTETFIEEVFAGRIVFKDSDPNPSCWHTWKHYVGFSEEYDYCDTCNAKRNMKP